MSNRSGSAIVNRKIKLNLDPNQYNNEYKQFVRKSSNLSKLSISEDKMISDINSRVKQFGRNRSVYLDNVAKTKVNELAKQDKYFCEFKQQNIMNSSKKSNQSLLS